VCISGAVGPLSEDGKTVGGAQGLGYHIVRRPKFRRPVLGGGVADRLGELIVGKAAERGWSVEAPTTRRTKGRP
jgi:hypothetical protein